MTTPPPFTGSLAEDWRHLSQYWLHTGKVLGAEVGPAWRMPDQHLACILFAETYPDSKPFLLDRLADSPPVVAAYAFKCLIRMTDLQRGEVPPSALSRTETVETVHHSVVETKTLGEFMENYFAQYAGQEELLEEQQRSMEWQTNQLAKYDQAIAREKRPD